MTDRERIFAVNPVITAAPYLQRNTAAPAPAPAPAPATDRRLGGPLPPALIASLNSPTTSTTMSHLPQTQQALDANLLRELTTMAVNNVVKALASGEPSHLVTALRNATGYADRLAVANAAVVVTNARQANEFHGYDANNPMGDLTPDPVFGGYDINNPAGN